MPDLVAFLRARLDEYEANEDWHRRECQTHQRMPEGAPPIFMPGAPLSCNCPVPEWMMADVEGKRRIVDAYLPPGENPHPGLPCVNYEGQDPASYDGYDSCERHIAANAKLLRSDFVLRLLALPYASHPDYREEWRP
jgi:hypothetical protein